MQEIQRMTARQRHTQQKSKYRHIIGITQQLVHNARGVLENTKDECAVDPMDDIIIDELRRPITIANSVPASSIRAAPACLRESRLQPREDLLDL
jgi:hypothetical protein